VKLVKQSVVPVSGEVVVYDLPDAMGSPSKFVVGVASGDNLSRAMEVLVIKTTSGIFHSSYGVIGDPIPFEIISRQGTSSIELAVRSTHTSVLNVTVTPLMGAAEIKAFI